MGDPATEHSGLESLQRRLNYVKLMFLFLDVGASVLVKTLEHLYQGPKPLDKNVADLAKVKSNNIYPAERETLERLKEEELKLSQLDITLTYKLLQLTCGLTDRNSPEGRLLWSKQCPKEKKQCLEHLLFRYKEMRNEIIHEFRKLEITFDDAFDKMRLKCEDLLIAITAEVEIRARLPKEEIEYWRQKLRGDMTAICQWELFPPVGSGGGPSEPMMETRSVAGEPSMFQSMGRKIKKRLGFEEDVSYVEHSEEGMSFRKVPSVDLIRSGILSRYGQELSTGNPDGQKIYFVKSVRNYWIDRLLSTDVLDSDNALLRFVHEYSGDQR